MSAGDEKNNKPTSTDEPLIFGVDRRSFLKYFAGAFATAVLPEMVAACGSTGVGETVANTGNSVDFTSLPMTWVTRKDDGLSLGFQFVNLVADSNHNIALTPGTPAGSAYVAITFPPQHVMEDAIAPPQTFTAPSSYPLNAYASATSRLVFNVPATYGVAVDAGGAMTYPYTLQGMLELCAISTPVVAPNAMSPVAPNAASTSMVAPLDEVDEKLEGLAQAKIDRVIARVDPKAAARVRRRVQRAARMLSGDAPGAHPMVKTPSGVTPVSPNDGQTCIELPFRVQMSPDQYMRWSFMSAPVSSPNSLATDNGRTELWHARMTAPHGDGLALRALYTRDWDVYGKNPLPSTTSDQTDPVNNPSPNARNREAIVQDTVGAATPLTVNRLILSPAGGTLDVSASFNPALSSDNLQAWKQTTVLGRDESVVCVNFVTILPGGWPGTLTTISKRADTPTNGQVVGVLYSETYLTIETPLVAFPSATRAPNPDYNTFPFVALEVRQTKIPCANAAGTSGWVIDPATGLNAIVGAVGTDWRGHAIKFSTPLYVCPAGATGASVCSSWNSGAGLFNMDRQRVAFAPPADGQGVASSSYSPDSTSYETASFNIVLNPPSHNANASAAQLVPVAQNITLAVEAVRHLQSSPTGGTPPADAVYDYDLVTYAPNGFSAANPNEVFLTLSGGAAPSIQFNKNPAQSGGLAAPALGASALSRSRGMISGAVAAKGASTAPTPPANPNVAGGAPSKGNVYNGGFNPADFFNGFNPQLFGFVPLTAIIQGLDSLASQYLPKAVTKELSNAEAFLEKAMALYNLLSSLVDAAASIPAGTAPDGSALVGPLQSILGQIDKDLTTYSQLAQGLVADAGAGALAGAPLTNAQMQAAAWMQSASTQAQVLINGYIGELSDIYLAASNVYDDITGLKFDELIQADASGNATGDLADFITAIEGFTTDLETLTGGLSAGASPDPQSAAGAVFKYFGPVASAIQSALNDVKSFLAGAEGVLSQLLTDLAAVSQGLDMAKSMSVEFKWKPIISGLEAEQVVAFIPSSNQAFSLDIKVDANSTSGPAGVNVTIRLDSFAICFGQGIPKPAPDAPVWLGIASPIACGFSQVEQNADVSLVFDHMQVQMLAGQKPAVDVVFTDIFFGGDLAFVETLKNLIPLDAFSDPPFVNVDANGITAGFSLGIPNVAVGMFSIQNMNISASLAIPFVSMSASSGITFTFGFCSIDNPFVVTVAMLGGGGFFTMTMDMNGLEGVALGIQVEAQIAIDIVVASGSVSIEVGIFLVYWNPADVPTTSPPIDPVTGNPESPGWLIGGYLRLRGELDVCGIITISIEIYLQITYSPSTGKCIASGFIAIDVSLFCFSLHTRVPFSRQFSGSNGDPTFAQMMGPGGVDPMMDPSLSATWDPFTEYCMAYS